MGTSTTRVVMASTPAARGEARLAQELAHGLLEPGLSTPAGEIACIGSREQDEVVIRRKAARNGPEGLAQQALDPVALDRTPHLPPNREPEPRRIGGGRGRPAEVRPAIRRCSRRHTRECVENEIAVRVRASVAIDALEVGGTREPPPTA